MIGLITSSVYFTKQRYDFVKFSHRLVKFGGHKSDGTGDAMFQFVRRTHVLMWSKGHVAWLWSYWNLLIDNHFLCLPKASWKRRYNVFHSSELKWSCYQIVTWLFGYWNLIISHHLSSSISLRVVNVEIYRYSLVMWPQTIIWSKNYASFFVVHPCHKPLLFRVWWTWTWWIWGYIAFNFPHDLTWQRDQRNMRFLL